MKYPLNLSRRQILNAVAAGAGGLFLPSLVERKVAHAAMPPKRLVIFHTQHGPTYGTWKRRFGDKPETSADWQQPLANATEADLGKIFAPLHAHRNDINIIDGLALTSALIDRNTNNHNSGNSHILTGARLQGDPGDPGDSSVDQIVAKAISAPGQVRSLTLCTWGAWSPVSDGKNNITPINEPRKAWKTLFQDRFGTPVNETYGAALKGGLGGGGAVGNDDFKKTAAARARMMSFVKDRYEKLVPRMSQEDRDKLEQHREMVANLAARFENDARSDGSGGGACSAPAYPGEEASVPGSVKRYMELIAAVAACDVTRVIVLVPNDYPASSFTDKVSGKVNVHQEIAHNAKEGAPEAGIMADYYRQLASDFADLVGRFKAVKEGDGTMLENSLLVWNTQIGNGTHDLYRMMTVTAGGAQGYLRTGRYLKYAEDQPSRRGSPSLGPAHSQFLVSIMQAMGLPNDKIGMTDSGLTGPLRHLKA